MSQTGTATASTTVASSVVSNIPETPTRLLAKVDDFQRIWQLVQSDDLAGSLYLGLRDQANGILRTSPSSYKLEGEGQLLGISRRTVKRIYNLGLMYRLGGDQRYSDRAWQELEAAANFPNWNPSDFLDTAEMSHAFAIGYDWFPWTNEERTLLRTAIVEKALKPALESYRRNEHEWSARHGWVNADHNWNQVCNGGIGMAALALLPDVPDLCQEILSDATRSIRVSMQRFAPDGAWIEGPVYWNYATLYSCVFLSALDTALGSDSGLSQTPAFSETGLFPIYMTGPTGRTFNFADTESDISLTSPQMFWLAREFSRPLYAWFARTNGDFACPDQCDGDYVCPGPCIGIPLGLLWFEPEASDPTAQGLPSSRYFRDTEAVTFRTTWNDPNSLFVGFKGGNNMANHGHLDMGSFVIDALRQRWALDLGKIDYNLYTGYTGTRFDFYRLRAEGHNTLALNPSKEPDQNPRAAAKIKRLQSQPERPFAIADLTTAYGETVQRGIAMLNGDSVVVQDELFPSRPTQLWWFMHTSAEIELSGDERSATLSRDSMRLWCAVASPPQARFAVMDARPLPTSPNPGGQDPNQGIRKLAIHISDLPLSIPFTLSVAMIPLTPSQEPPAEPPPVTALAEW